MLCKAGSKKDGQGIGFGMKKFFPLGAATLAFLALVLFSSRAASGAREGLMLCARTLAPSLFPFFVLSRLLSALGMTDILSRRAGPLMQKLFRVSGAGAEAFLIGITGGYPLGAATVAGLRRSGRLHREEAQRLLAFCNNSGPAFILGAAGAVFGSGAAGAVLYAAHVLGAVSVGLVFRGRAAGEEITQAMAAPAQSFAEAFPAAVSGAAGATATVCSYVCFFSAMLALAGDFSFLPEFWRCAATGFFELGSGIASLRGFPPEPPYLALAALMLGWGGLSVHGQTLGVLAGTDIKCARHLAGRALCGVFSAAYAFVLSYLI